MQWFAGDLHENEELVYREEWDTGSFEAAGFNDGRLPTAREHDLRGIDSAEPSASGAVWSRRTFLSLFSNMWTTGKRWLHPTDQHDQIVSNSRYTYVCVSVIFLFDLYALNQVRYRDQLLDCIGNSPLLTEDDFHLVQFIVSNQTHRSSTKHHSQRQSGHHLPRNRHTILFLTAFLVGLIAIAAALLPIQYILVLSILATLTGGVPLTIRWRMKLAVEQRLEKSVDSLQNYLREFEMLLSLVTQTTRVIRETEIIAHGFSR